MCKYPKWWLQRVDARKKRFSLNKVTIFKPTTFTHMEFL